MKAADIKVSTVAIGTHGAPGNSVLQSIASTTGGKYYVVRDPNALPRIYQKEARKVARPLIVERPLSPQIVARHEILEGINAVPPISGFVMTRVKESGLVEVPIVSPYPPDTSNASILATWNYGLGRAAVFTTDAGYQWATQWTGWDQYDKFFSQLVRWSMRPTGDTGNFSIATSYEDGMVRVVVDAVDKEDEFLNFLNFNASVVDPDMQSTDVELRQTSPGRYVAEFTADQAGSHFLTISPGAGMTPLRTGINIPYSPEYRDRETNFPLLRNLASLEPKGGDTGQLLTGGLTGEDNEVSQLLQTDTFRRDLAPSVSINYVWPWLALIAGCVFVADVFVRRVAISFAPLIAFTSRLIDNWKGRNRSTSDGDRLEQLRRKKSQVGDDIDRQKAATRFEPVSDEPVSVEVLDPAKPQPSKPPAASAKPAAEAEKQEDDYTARLLRAKQQARKKSPGGGPQENDPN
jgi:hypothetical protein